MAEQPIDKNDRYYELLRTLLELDAGNLELNKGDRERLEKEIYGLEETIPVEDRETLHKEIAEELAADIKKKNNN